MKTFQEYLGENKIGKGKATLKDVPFMAFDDAEDDLKSMGIKVSKKKRGPNRDTLATLTGTKKKLFLYLTGADYGLSDQDAYDEYPELMEGLGNARRRGNADTFHDNIAKIKKIAKTMDNFEFSAIDSKAKDQAHQVGRISSAIGEMLDSIMKLKQIDKRSK